MMTMPSTEATTELLLALRKGDRQALDRFMPRVYDELHRIAHRELARVGGGGTLRTTGLVHEAYLKLVDQTRVQVEDRAHFLALAATDELVRLDDALQRLERFDERLRKVVECRFFGGMTVEATAAALEVAPRTVDRAWKKSKAWLYREIHEA